MTLLINSPFRSFVFCYVPLTVFFIMLKQFKKKKYVKAKTDARVTVCLVMLALATLAP